MNFSEITGFDWDDYNIFKNIERHDVYDSEAEQIFFNHPVVIKDDEQQPGSEKRYYALGQTNHGRYLFASFTIRGNKIRVISVRDMNKKEVRVYENF